MIEFARLGLLGLLGLLGCSEHLAIQVRIPIPIQLPAAPEQELDTPCPTVGKERPAQRHPVDELVGTQHDDQGLWLPGEQHLGVLDDLGTVPCRLGFGADVDVLPAQDATQTLLQERSKTRSARRLVGQTIAERSADDEDAQFALGELLLQHRLIERRAWKRQFCTDLRELALGIVGTSQIERTQDSKREARGKTGNRLAGRPCPCQRSSLSLACHSHGVMVSRLRTGSR